MIGIKTAAIKLATQLFTANTVFADIVNLNNIQIAANQRMHLRFYIPITVGAAGGAKFQLTGPAAPAFVNISAQIVNTVAPSITPATANAFSTSIGDALANAGTHFLLIDVGIRNGATAGTIALQMAQNSSNATALQVLETASVDITKF